MDTDSIAAKERKTRRSILRLRLDRGEGRGEVSNFPLNHQPQPSTDLPATAGISPAPARNGGMRGGTECVPLIVGMAKAAELARKQVPGYEKKVRPLRDPLEEGILNSIPNTELNGHKSQRLANTTNVTLHGIESEALLILLDQEGICASSGSACLADSDEASHVVKAMKPDSAASRQMIRFSLGTETNSVDIEKAVAAVRKSVAMLRG
jgi:cysteine desulfurase